MNTTAPFTLVSTATRLIAAVGSAAVTLVLFAAVMTMADVPPAEAELATVAANVSAT